MLKESQATVDLVPHIKTERDITPPPATSIFQVKTEEELHIEVTWDFFLYINFSLTIVPSLYILHTMFKLISVFTILLY